MVTRIQGTGDVAGPKFAIPVSSTEIGSGKSRTVEELQDVNGDWHTIDTQICGKG